MNAIINNIADTVNGAPLLSDATIAAIDIDIDKDKGLTEMQQAGVIAKLPTLVDAAPGSGKTFTLVHRIEKAFQIDKLKPENILVVTFTRKAAGEMTKRVQKICNQTLGRMGTFHSVVHKLNADRPELIKVHGYTDGYISPTAADSGKLIRELVKEREDRLNGVSVKDAVKFCKDGISNLKSRGLYPVHYHMATQSVFLGNIFLLTDKFKVVPVCVGFEVFREYQLRMLEMNALDFDDLISLGAFALRDDAIREKVIRDLKLVIVDEFQDTSEMQLELVRHLSGDYKNIFVVGDVDQTLYEWRNASVGQYMNFVENLAGEVCFLEENFRSTGNIVRLSYAVIADNRKRTNKEVKILREAGSPVVSIRPKDHREEAEYIVSDIKRKIEAGIRPSEIAILYRSRRYPDFIEKEFIEERIDYHIVKGQKFFDRNEVKYVLAYFRLAVNPADDLSFLQIYNYPKRRNGKKFINEVKTRSHINKCSYLEAIKQFMPKLSNANKEFLQIIDSISKDMAKMTVPQTILHRLSMMLDLEEDLMLEHGPDEGIERYDALNMLATMLDMTLLEFDSYKEALSELSISEDDNFEETDDNQVQLMTVHAAKGLEFENVYIAGAVDGIMPSINASVTPDEEKGNNRYDHSNLEEERRIFYVAISRAKDELLISSPHYIYRNGKTSAYDRTMFLAGKDHLLDIRKVR